MSVRPADKEVAAQVRQSLYATAQPSSHIHGQQFNGMKQELSAIASKIGELEMEKEEHQLRFMH